MTDFEKKEALEPIESQGVGHLNDQHDAVFGDLSKGGPKYRNVSCLLFSYQCKLICRYRWDG